MNKAELLEKINKGWDDFNAYLATLTPTQVTEPRDAAGWRALDHIIHIADWENGVLAMLNYQDRVAAMGSDKETWAAEDADKINALLQQRSKDKTLGEARGYVMAIHQALVDKVNALSDEDLQRPYQYYQPESEEEAPVIRWVQMNTYEHYEEHKPWIAVIAADSQQITKAQLLAKTQASWDQLNAYVGTLNEKQLTQLTDAAGWTVKDHLVHLSVWEDGIWALLNKRDRAAEMGVDTEAWKRWDFAEINGIIQRRHKDLSWVEVQQKRQAGHQRFIAQIEATSEADLNRPIKDFQTNSTGKTPVIEVIVGDAFSHYDTHLPWIKAIAESGN